MSNIFISYAREDQERAQELAHALEAQNWEVFWDPLIPAGKTWSDVLEQKLEAAECLVVLWSRSSISSDWVKEEAGKGKERGILIPVLIEDVKPPLGFGSLQAADFSKWDGTGTDACFKSLVRDITAMLGPASAKEATPLRAEEQGRERAAAERQKEEERKRRASEAEELQAAHREATRQLADNMSTEGYSEDFYKGPAYALVIGVSQYKYGCDPGQELAPHQFPNLEFAAKDAKDFANFLSNYGFINYNVTSLLNEDADLTRIKVELEQLRAKCKQSTDPLVIVYFSGHGWADSENRHYLIPWEAKRDNLRPTAFMNTEFNDYLDELPTNRLVVFLDACHSGAMGMPGVKGGLQQYVHKGLGEGEGRYLIASCGPGQQSYEWKAKENGIFTRHLIELLACKTGDFDEEEIDIFNLFPVLSKKVKATAWEVCNAQQEPIGDVKAGRGIILAINQQVKDKKAQKDQKAQRVRFLEIICTLIRASDSRQKTIIAVKLRTYVVKDKRLDGYDDFYGVFDEYLGLWREDQRSRLDECRDLLISTHGDAVASPAVSKEDQSQQPSTPDDKFVSPAENKVLGAEESTAPATPISQPDLQQPRRQLSDVDRDYLLEEIITKLSYYSATRTLSDVLSRPISEAEFSRTIYRVGESKKDDEVLRGIIDRIIGRFEKCWPRSKEVESKTVSSLMLGKGR